MGVDGVQTTILLIDFSAFPDLAALQPHNTSDVEVLYHVAHFDVITRLNPIAMLPFPQYFRVHT